MCCQPTELILTFGLLCFINFQLPPPPPHSVPKTHDKLRRVLNRNGGIEVETVDFIAFGRSNSVATVSEIMVKGSKFIKGWGVSDELFFSCLGVAVRLDTL